MRFFKLLLFIAFVSAGLSGTGAAQSFQTIDRNAFILSKLSGSIEGYAEAIGGELIDYPRLREDRPFALITRATTGTHAIEWKSAPVASTGGDVSFVVHAGVLSRPDAHFRFVLIVNDTAQVAFTTVDTLTWEAGDSSGVRLTFYGAMRDQHTDAFGLLQIRVPGNYITPGEPVRFRMVGDSAGSRVWFMVFRDSDILNYLTERVANETACTIEAADSGKTLACTLSAPLTWLKRHVAYSDGSTLPRQLHLHAENDTARATFTMQASSSSTLEIYVDGEKYLSAPAPFRNVHQSILHTKKLTSLTSADSPAGWVLHYNATYAPLLSSALLKLSDAPRKSDTLHLVISTHQDIAWMDSPAQCIQDRDEKILAPALDVMKSDPAYRFDLEDVLFLREFLERHPDRKEDLRSVLASGQLGIGASYNQPYEELASGEMLIRQFYAGRKWLKSNFPGCDARTYWNPDVPARTAQMPQIMHKAGVKYLFMSRFGKGLYRWYSPDSSSILAMSPGHYADFYERVGRKDFPEKAGFIANFAREWSSEIPSGSPTVPIVSMTDMSTPIRYGEMIGTWNGFKSISLENGTTEPLTLPVMRYSSAEDFFNSVSAEISQPSPLLGERPNVWLYIHGPTHHWAISAKREADALLPAAETFSTIDALLEKSFDRYPQRELTAAWESQIYPDHGWGGKNGDITDSTFRAKYEFARDTGARLAQSAAQSIAARIRTSPSKGLPVVVFNNLSWRRSAPARIRVDLAPGEFRQGFALYDAAGRVVPSQVLSFTQHPDGSVRSSEILFIAENVPPVGYLTMYLRRSPQRPNLDTTSAPVQMLENRHYTISFVPGGVRQITDITLQKDLLNTEKFLGGELFTMQSVGEDAGEWSEPQQPTMEGFDQLSNYAPAWKLVESGAVRQVAELRQEINHVTVVQRVILYRLLKQIDFETDLLNWDGEKYREFRIAFPVQAENGRVAYEVPFGAVEIGKDELKGVAGERYLKEVSTIRPRAIQNWINESGADVGVTIGSSVAVWDYLDPTDQPVSSPILQPVLLTSRRSCHGLGPWYLQQGDHFYRFSLTSHRPGWRNGRRFGVGSNTPLIIIFNPQSSGALSLPEEKSFLSIGAENIVLSTLKKSEDDNSVVLRLFEDAGTSVSARLRFTTILQKAQKTNIIEEEGNSIPFRSDELPVILPHHSIETYKLLPLF